MTVDHANNDGKKITLTIDEAKQVQRAIVLARYLTKCINHEKELSNLYERIGKRIEQVVEVIDMRKRYVEE